MAKKRPKFGAMFDNFRLWSRLSSERIIMSKVGKYHYQLQPIPRWTKKNLVNFGPQTTELKLLILTKPSWHFSGDYISAIRGCCPLIFLHALELDPGYLAHTPIWTGVSPKKFNRENLKFGLKFSVWATITSGLVGVSSRNFFQSTCRRVGVIMWVPFSEGPPPKICDGEKTSKIRRYFWQLSTLIAIIFGTYRHVESREKPSSTATPSTLDQNIWWTLVRKQQSYSGSYWPSQVDIFRETTFRPLCGAAPSNF